MALTAPYRRTFDAHDVHGLDIIGGNASCAPNRSLLRAEPALLLTSDDPFPDDYLLVEGATVVHHVAHTLDVPEGAGGAAVMCRRHVWHSHLEPRLQVVVDDAAVIESSVYQVPVQTPEFRAGEEPLRILVAKMAPLNLGMVEELRQLLNMKIFLWPPFGNHKAVPAVLRDAYYGRLCGMVACARRIFLNPFSLMTLHPIADADLLKLVGPLRLTDAALCERVSTYVFKSILAQLKDLEARGVVHNDIKPENILFWEKGIFSLNDFSSAYSRWETHLFDIQQLYTSQRYAPYDEDMGTMVEYDLNGRWLHPGKDIYALGNTILFLATGVQPFSLPLGTNNINKIIKRQEFWQRIYPDIIAFCQSDAPQPNLTSAHVGRRKDDRERAAMMRKAFGTLRERAPTLVIPVCRALHPFIAHRPSASDLLQEINVSGRDVAPQDPAVVAWLRGMPLGRKTWSNRNLVHFRREPHMLRPRRHSDPGVPYQHPWDTVYPDSHVSTTAKVVALQLRQAARDDLMMSHLHPYVRERMLVDHNDSADGMSDVTPSRSSSISGLSASAHGLNFSPATSFTSMHF